AYAMLQQGMDMSPLQSPWQGAARLAQALMGGLEIRQQDDEQRAAEASAAPTEIAPGSCQCLAAAWRKPAACAGR
ncbi:hypothetical protein ACC756_39010, partial [Rhizobium ruizarguesonis]